MLTYSTTRPGKSIHSAMHPFFIKGSFSQHSRPFFSSYSTVIPTIQKKCTACEDEDKQIQRKINETFLQKQNLEEEEEIQTKLSIGQADDKYEREADVVADRVVNTPDVDIQRQEAPEEEEKKDPVSEGLKTTGKQLLKNPKFKAWYEPRLDRLTGTLWDKRSSDEKAALVTFGILNLGLAGFAFSQSPELRELLSDINIGAPLGWIPYSPIEGFKYTLPKQGESKYGFGADFSFNPYLDLIRKRHPSFPLTGASFGLETSYEKGAGLSLTGGKFGLEFLGGGLSVEGKSFSSLSQYPQMIPGQTPNEPPAWLMQSVPGLPNLQTGPGFQVMLKADILKLIK